MTTSPFCSPAKYELWLVPRIPLPHLSFSSSVCYPLPSSFISWGLSQGIMLGWFTVIKNVLLCSWRGQPNTYLVYRIAGNFGKVFNLANWQFCGKSPNLKPANIISYTIVLCGSARNRQILICLCILMTDSPNYNARQGFPLYGTWRG